MGIIIKDGVIYGNNEPHPEFIEVMPNAGFHNSIFRGKYLGASFTEAQSNAIKAGTFDDLFIGDYWTINGVNWRIADFDTYYQTGSMNTIIVGHHITVVPDTNFYIAQWNDTADTSSGYVGSAIRANIKAASASAAGAEEKVIAAFGSSHVLNYTEQYPTTYVDGEATATNTTTDTRVELMSEFQLLGAQAWSIGGRGFEIGMGNTQFSLFRLAPQFVHIRAAYWTRSVRNAVSVAIINGFGAIGYASVTNSTSIGVRPFALIA